jgi:uncharacterized membrane protein YjjP (DUF1212 family)
VAEARERGIEPVNGEARRAPFDDRAAFLAELGRRLHICGVSASRLEGALRSVAGALGLTCQTWSTPTGLLLSLGDVDWPMAPQQTRVLRLEPGNTDLSALVTLDTLAEDVSHGRLGLDEAWRRMLALDRPQTPREEAVMVLSFGLAASAVAGLLRTGWLDVAVAGALGLLIGWMTLLSFGRPHVAAAHEAVAALVATFLATAFAHFVAPLSMQTVVLAALIVLMPGLTLTTAVTELATQQLVSGTTRFAGAVMTLLKLTFGGVVAAQLTRALGWTPALTGARDLPVTVEVVSIVAASFSFALLFRTARRDVLLVMLAASVGYVITRVAGELLSTESGTFAAGVFLSSLATAAAANAYGRWRGRPGTLIRVPGIMLLVPGSVSFRAIGLVMEREYTVGVDTLIAVVSALIAIVAGTLFGSLLIPPRRYL